MKIVVNLVALQAKGIECSELMIKLMSANATLKEFEIRQTEDGKNKRRVSRLL